MKILYYGNKGNTGYRFTRWLNQSGVETKLVYDEKNTNARSHPTWELNQGKSPYQEKIYAYEGTVYNQFFPPESIKKLAKNVDLVLATGNEIIPAFFLNKPLIIRSTGGDVTGLPFNSNNLKNEIRSWIYRQNSHKIAGITVVQEDAFYAAKLLEVKNIINLSIPVDINWMNSNIDKTLKKNLEQKYKKYKLVFFNPTRKNIQQNERAYKGVEKIIPAFEKLLNRISEPNSIKLITGIHGHHALKYKKMIMNSKIPSKQVDFVGHLQRPQLHAYFSLDNLIILDKFLNNTNCRLGGSAREALALGTPLISSIDSELEKFTNGFGANCPHLRAINDSDIYKKMYECYSMSKKQFKDLKTKSKTWVKKNLNWQKLIPKYISEFRKILDQTI